MERYGYGTHDGYTTLWVRVLFQALLDATATKIKGRKYGGATLYDEEIDEARDWLLLNEEDFRTVCHFAGLDPDVIRDYAWQLFNREWVRDESLKYVLRMGEDK